MMSATRLAYLL